MNSRRGIHVVGFDHGDQQSLREFGFPCCRDLFDCFAGGIEPSFTSKRLDYETRSISIS